MKVLSKCLHSSFLFFPLFFAYRKPTICWRYTETILPAVTMGFTSHRVPLHLTKLLTPIRWAIQSFCFSALPPSLTLNNGDLVSVFLHSFVCGALSPCIGPGKEQLQAKHYTNIGTVDAVGFIHGLYLNPIAGVIHDCCCRTLLVFIENARQGKVWIGSANDLALRPNADVSLVQCLSLPLRLYGDEFPANRAPAEVLGCL